MQALGEKRRKGIEKDGKEMKKPRNQEIKMEKINRREKQDGGTVDENNQSSCWSIQDQKCLV